jgi:hypothetical protein
VPIRHFGALSVLSGFILSGIGSLPLGKEGILIADEMPLSAFSLRLGASISEDGTSISFAGQGCGFVVFGPYLPFKMGLYTFVVDILFPWHLAPRACIDIYGDGVIFASQRISTHCTTIRIQAHVKVDCKLEVRLHSDRTPFEIKRVAYSLGVVIETPNVTPLGREELSGMLVRMINADGPLDGLQDWADPANLAKTLFSDNHFQAVAVQSLHEHEGILRQAGIMPAVIEAFFDQNNSARIDGTAPGDLVDGSPKLTNAFQQGIAMSGWLELMSPYDASIIRTQNSIPVPSFRSLLPILYEFQGKNPIIVGVGNGWTGAVSFIWFVKHDIVVYNDVTTIDWLGFEQVICRYLAFCVRHAEQIAKYRKSTHTLAVASGFNSNMGHYFWNETSGLERLIRLTGLIGVQAIYSPQSRWLSIKEIFATDDLPAVVELEDWEKLSDEVLNQNQILVHPTGTQYDDKLALKVRRAAEARFFAGAPERCQNAKDLSSDGQFVLYVNLRAHNKAWVEQDEGILEIVHALRSVQKGDIVVYLDGYPDCADSASNISSKQLDGVTYVIGIAGSHADLSETIYWAFRSDFFLAVIGSGLVPLTWLANRPGLCYGDNSHLSQMAFWHQVRHNTAPVGWPAADHIRDVSGRADHVNYSHASYSIDPAYMVELFLEIWRRTKTETVADGETFVEAGWLSKWKAGLLKRR